MIPIELSILDFIQIHFRGETGDILMPFISGLGNKGGIWLVLAIILLLLPKSRKLGAAVLMALVLILVSCNMIVKPLVHRIRPCDINTAIQLLIPHPIDYSFPSGHTAASFAAASAIFFGGRKLWIPAAALAVMISFSRLYLYVHFPTDVLAGALLGILMGYLGWKLVCFMEVRMQKRRV